MATNVPVSIWRKTNGLNENEYTGLNFIVDPLGNFLVDPQNNFIIDIGIRMNVTPPTIWIEDDSL